MVSIPAVLKNPTYYQTLFVETAENCTTVFFVISHEGGFFVVTSLSCYSFLCSKSQNKNTACFSTHCQCCRLIQLDSFTDLISHAKATLIICLGGKVWKFDHGLGKARVRSRSRKMCNSCPGERQGKHLLQWLSWFSITKRVLVLWMDCIVAGIFSKYCPSLFGPGKCTGCGFDLRSRSGECTGESTGNFILCTHREAIGACIENNTFLCVG